MTTTTRTTRNRTKAVDPDEFDSNDKPPWEDGDSTTGTHTRRPRSRQRAEDEETGDEDADGEETVIPISRGREAIQNSRPNEAGGMYFKWPENDKEETVIKFLDEDPWSYNQHWVTRKGKQSFVCIGSGCPLCEIGAKISQKIVYAILNISHADGPTVQAMEVTPTVDEDLIGLDAGKSGPLPRLYWSASRPKKARPTGYAKYNYTFVPIKERDLGDDYEVDLDQVEAALKDAVGHEPEKVLGTVSRRLLQEIADEVMEK